MPVNAPTRLLPFRDVSVVVITRPLQGLNGSSILPHPIAPLLCGAILSYRDGNVRSRGQKRLMSSRGHAGSEWPTSPRLHSHT